MATAGDFQTLDRGEAYADAARLRQAQIGPATIADRPAGPFDIAPSPAAGSVARDTLITGLLVIYPAFATVAAIVVGLALTRGV